MADDRLRVNFAVTDNATPIYNKLVEDFTQLYADAVLARKVEADINENKETTNVEPAEAVDGVNDVGGAPGEGDLLDK